MNKRAFTLIELSIMLIIIGLIIGGILAGTELVKQAKTRSLINEINGYIIAFGTFKLKYDAVPGDMPNAKTFWTGSGNGNGNGQIEFIETVTGNGIEWLRTWDHLSLAEMIPNKIVYSGSVTPTSNPISKVSNTVWTSSYEGPLYKSGPYNFLANATKLSAADMYVIDLKIDDGKASAGKFLTLQSSLGDGLCVTNGWTSPSAEYILTDPSITCRLYYILPF